jgi:hypothetical protein
VDALRKSLIDRYIGIIDKSIDGTKNKAPSLELYDLYQKKKYPALVSNIRERMGLERFPMKVKVGKVRSGAAALVERDR